MNSVLRRHLLELLKGGGAHLTFDEAIADLPVELRGARIKGCPHTPWRLLEHLRLCQWDILEFSRSAQHLSPPFPEGYWPKDDAPPTPDAWDRSIKAFHADRQAFIEIVSDPSTDLFAPIPHGDGQTILREAMLIADHNAYHLGQLVILRRSLGAWKDE